MPNIKKKIVLAVILLIAVTGAFFMFAIASAYSEVITAISGRQEEEADTDIEAGDGDIILSSGILNHPAPQDRNITSPFGWRICPYHGREFHSGIDLSASGRPTPIVAAESGIVVTAGWYGGYGNCIIISHGGKMWTLYGHLQTLYVRSGSKVERGQKIALKGSTGNSTGPHLHFEVRKGSNSTGAVVNPTSLIK